MKVRRIVTGHEGDKSVIVDDDHAPRETDFTNIPGMSAALVWGTSATPNVPHTDGDPTPTMESWVPATGETRLMLVEFPPDSVFMSSDFDPAAAGEEQMAALPGLAERFEPDNPGMHTTDTVDYGIVLEGEVWLELDDGIERHLRQGDVVVQNGTRHAWRNKRDTSVTVAFVLIGAERRTS